MLYDSHAMKSTNRCPPASQATALRAGRHERAGGGQTPGALHHVIGRGINRRKIFSCKIDYMNFFVKSVKRGTFLNK